MFPHHFGRVMITLTALLAAPRDGSAGEAHYLLMFGSQRVPNDPDYAHSFATFVRFSWPGDGSCPEGALMEETTISWGPASGVVRTYALRPECGRNSGLHDTIQRCLCSDMRVSLWGPYPMCPELYCLAERQVALLQSGQVLYKANDWMRSSDRVSNCIHALSSIVEGNRLRVASPGWGEVASFAILQRFEPYLIQPACPEAWVGSALGLDQYPIIYRDWERPRSGALDGVYRLLGGERDLQATYGPPVR